MVVLAMDVPLALWAEPEGTSRDMGSREVSLLYLIVMVAVVVVVDWRFLRRQLWRRLAVNISIIVVFLAGYWMILRQP
jgi:hypothetical protein